MSEPNETKKPATKPALSSDSDVFVSAISDTADSSSSQPHVCSDEISSRPEDFKETAKDVFLSPLSDTDSSTNSTQAVISLQNVKEPIEGTSNQNLPTTTQEQAIQTQEISLDSIMSTSDNDEDHEMPSSLHTIVSKNSSQSQESNLSLDVNEQFHRRTIYGHEDQDNSSNLPKEVELPSPVIFPLSSQQILNQYRRVNLPLRYSVEYCRMEQRFSPRTLAEIYDDELFSYYDKHGESTKIKMNHKEGILCCFITGLAIALLVLTAFMLTLLVEPIVEIMKSARRSLK
ncbi:uncharacterized protein LOC109612159 [Musca domestica]|uniref:Uncharacterized protein LOC109612159 n=1 Tax=Musca domestica TaxID=7370 RepID=A0A9J7ICH9_MUSDO|nr:uncharacterized protein LOC109612159 [Musca domestica]XP_058980884.1 uncharacterized protein LOC109612159 [Musca domestica]